MNELAGEPFVVLHPWLDDQNAVAELAHGRGDRRAGQTAAGDDDVEIMDAGHENTLPDTSSERREDALFGGVGQVYKEIVAFELDGVALDGFFSVQDFFAGGDV